MQHAHTKQINYPHCYRGGNTLRERNKGPKACRWPLGTWTTIPLTHTAKSQPRLSEAAIADSRLGGPEDVGKKF